MKRSSPILHYLSNAELKGEKPMPSHTYLPEIGGRPRVNGKLRTATIGLTSICCGRSSRLLQRPSQHGAEALAAAVPALETLHDPAAIRFGNFPPEQTGLAQRCGLRLRSILKVPYSPASHFAIICSGLAAVAMNWFFCFSLWFSLLLALWMTRGWIGVFFSGQVLSTGTWLVKKLTQRTQAAWSARSDLAGQLEGVHDVF